MNRREQNTLMDRHNKIMAAILTRFRNMVLAATEPLPTAAAIPQASLNAMTMNNEVSALIKEVENLLALTREIKQLWIAGPLRKPGDADEKSRDKEMDEKAFQVSKLYNRLVELQSENTKNATQQTPVVAEDGQHVDVKRDNGDVSIKYEG
ncbi:putative mediator of RNA polymerase ii transcription subunit 22 protein [Rosellinia necatrix]|uniref:Putative mediator of RNA polymerase ii transcription subunit 22 protein n=1 Tax=Rosellinia necatrix TaxID=77044 RepID=A0A1W2THS9_ROSNE|nr:putative mediator of RNA polymerase ii transcription subunit 22 protein [Rosellinia necatrix]